MVNPISFYFLLSGRGIRMLGSHWNFVVPALLVSLLGLLAMADDIPPRTKAIYIETSTNVRNCREAQLKGYTGNGIYTIYPYDCCSTRSVKVYCDMTTDGGGWTVIQKRDNITPREDFFRTWMEYAIGFGNPAGEYWLGLDHINALTGQSLNEIRFDLWDFQNNTRFAKYKFFYVHDRAGSFKAEVNGYSGNAGDSFSGTNGMFFTTKDKDLDNAGDNCAKQFSGAWWYDQCHKANLNGLYLGGPQSSYADGVNWDGWLGLGYSLKKTEMKIRPYYLA